MKLLTIFTPTYNRAHTLRRTYQSLCEQTCKDFIWLVVDDGSTDETKELVELWKIENKINIIYAFKENGGLYTGYNLAYQLIDTELNVCIDSDDYMPVNAVELIVDFWNNYGSSKYIGIIGLDYLLNGKPIGGKFPDTLKETYMLDLYIKRIHFGDTKSIMRTDIMKKIAPQIGFDGEKNFNPIYMLLQADEYGPLLVLNENLCNVEYQISDSMSKTIFQQYLNSPKSFAKLRKLEMTLSRNNFRNRFRSAVHYVSSCIISRDPKWISNSPKKILTIIAIPFGIVLYFFILYKSRK